MAKGHVGQRRQRQKALQRDDLIKACSRSAQTHLTLSVALMSAPLPTSISAVAVWA